MAVKTSIQIQGAAISSLERMTAALNKVINRFERLQQVLSSNVNTQGLDRINRCLLQMQNNIANASRRAQQLNPTMNTAQNNAGRMNQNMIIINQTIQQVNASLHITQNNIGQIQNNTSHVVNNIRQAVRETEVFNDQVQRGNSAVSGLARSIKSMVGAYIGLRGLQQGMQAVDNFSNQRARLSMIVDDGGSAEEQEKKVKELENKIFSAAQRSAGNYNDMVNTVAKLGITAKKAFQSNDELIKFSELMQKSFAVSGASVGEISSGMEQLTQAMASGRLQGDEFRSIIENAPMLANAIAEYTGVGMEGLKQLSSEGAISADIIKNALFSAGEDIEKKFEKMPVTFTSAWTDIKNTSFMHARDMMSRISSILNSDMGRNAIEGVRSTVHTLITVLAGVVEMILYITSAVQQNWGVIVPILMLAITWITSYKMAMLASAIATKIQTIAQNGLNRAIYKCPIFWIVAAIMLLITIIFLAVKAINKWKKTNISAVGIVAGIFSVFRTTFHNIFVRIWNTVAAFINFFANVFKDPVAAVQILFLDLATNVLGYVKTLAQGIEDAVNKIPGVEIELTNGIENLEKKASDKLKDIKSKAEWEEVVKTKEYWQYSDKIKDAYQWGAGVEDKIADKLENIELDIPGFTDSPLLESMKETADNTGKIADSLEMDKDDLEYIRDMANSKYANKYIMPQIKLEMVNHNAIASDLDIDGIVDKMTQKVGEALAVSAEGAYI